MKRIALFALFCASFATLATINPQQSGTLLQMDSVQCGTDQNSAKSLSGELIGTDSAHQKMRTLLCQEYLLQTDRITYRIRPKDNKHPTCSPSAKRCSSASRRTI